MEVITVKGGVTEISPTEMARALQRGGRRQVDLPQEQPGGELLVDEVTGKAIFEPTGPDPLNLRGMEIDLPQDHQHLGFAFGGQPIIFADENGNAPEPCQIIGYSIPGGPSYSALSDLQGQIKAQAAAQRETALAAERALAASSTVQSPLIGTDQPTARKYSFQQNGKAHVTRITTGPPTANKPLGSPRFAEQPMRASTGLRQKDYNGTRNSPNMKPRLNSEYSVVTLPEKPRMLFRTGDNTTTNQLYHQRLRPGQRIKPGEMCCGGNFNVTQSAANALRATADWLSTGSGTTASPAHEGLTGRKLKNEPINKPKSAVANTRDMRPLDRDAGRRRRPMSDPRTHTSRQARPDIIDPRQLSAIGSRTINPSRLNPSPNQPNYNDKINNGRPLRCASAHIVPADLRGGIRSSDTFFDRVYQPGAESPGRQNLPQSITYERRVSHPANLQTTAPDSSSPNYAGLTVEHLRNIPVVTAGGSLDLGGILTPLIKPDSLIPGVPTRYEKPISRHPQIPAIDASGRAQLVLEEQELRQMGLTPVTYEQLRGGEAHADESPMSKANRMIAALRADGSRSPVVRPMSAEEEARHLRTHELMTKRAISAAANRGPIEYRGLAVHPQEGSAAGETSGAAAVNAAAATIGLDKYYDSSNAYPMLHSPKPTYDEPSHHIPLPSSVGPTPDSQYIDNMPVQQTPRQPESLQQKPRQPESLKQYELTTETGESRVVEKLTLNSSPRVELLRSFLSAEECEILNPKLQALDQDPQVPNNLLAATELDENLNKWISRILNRIAQLTAVQVESIVGLCPSTITKGALDATKDFSTIVRIYLDEHEGAASEFPELGITVRPKLGAALRWDCKDAEGQATNLAKHKEVSAGDYGRKLFTAYLI